MPGSKKRTADGGGSATKGKGRKDRERRRGGNTHSPSSSSNCTRSDCTCEHAADSCSSEVGSMGVARSMAACERGDRKRAAAFSIRHAEAEAPHVALGRTPCAAHEQGCSDLLQ